MGSSIFIRYYSEYKYRIEEHVCPLYACLSL
jgi:hypothetical protein